MSNGQNEQNLYPAMTTEERAALEVVSRETNQGFWEYLDGGDVEAIYKNAVLELLHRALVDGGFSYQPEGVADGAQAVTTNDASADASAIKEQ